MRNRWRIGLALASLVLATLAVTSTGRSARAAAPDGSFPLVNYGSLKCVEVVPVDGNFYLNANRVWQRTCDGAPQQSWFLVPVRKGGIAGFGNVQLYHVVNRLTLQCLDVKDGWTTNRAIVQQWTCNADGTSMLWGIFADVWTARQLVNARSGRCLDVDGGSADDFAMLQQYGCFGFPNSAQLYFMN